MTTPSPPIDETLIDPDASETSDVGSSRRSGVAPSVPTPTEDEKIVIKIKAQGGEATDFLVGCEMTFGKIINKYCKLKELQKQGLRFVYNGIRVVDADTPAAVSLCDDSL